MDLKMVALWENLMVETSESPKADSSDTDLVGHLVDYSVSRLAERMEQLRVDDSAD